MTDKLNVWKLADFAAAATRDATALLAQVYERIAATADQNVFIEQVPYASAVAQLEKQRQRSEAGETLELFGVPFAVKDNFDVAGLATTAACPAFAYTAKDTAFAVALLIEAGAILVGKTNLDQFATGLVGTRSPYGICRSAIHPDYISGGSSSGSALAVALGIVPFALGTDTAGSGRVPAAFNGIVGLKPTRGLVSNRGLVAACRSLDCVSVFAQSVTDAAQVLRLLAQYDERDPFSRRDPQPRRRPDPGCLRIGVPTQLDFFGNRAFEQLYDQSIHRILGRDRLRIDVDVQPFLSAGELLYGGPWVAERFASVGEFVESDAGSVHPVVRDIILSGKQPRAYELFHAQYQLATWKRATDAIWDTIDLLVLPTTGTIYKVDAVLQDPVQLNKILGRYTNFVNLLDLSGLAVPAGVTDEGLPFGITLMGPAFAEETLIEVGKDFFS